MRDYTFKRNLKKLRDYGKLFGLKIILRKNAETRYESSLKTIMIDSSDNRNKIIETLLHEIGHHHDDSLHSLEIDNNNVRTAYHKLNKHDHEIDMLFSRRIKLANSIESGHLKEIILKIAKNRLILLNNSEEKILREFRGDKSNRLSMRQRKLLTHPYRYFSRECVLTLKQKNLILEVERRAWDYGEKIAKMIGIKINKSFYKNKEESLNSYRRFILTMEY